MGLERESEQPVSFALDEKQYVVIAAGSALYAFGLP